MKVWQVATFVVVLLSAVLTLDMMGLTKHLSELDQLMMLLVPSLIFLWLMQRGQTKP